MSAPYGQASYGQAPYGQAPYGQAPYGQAPYGQQMPQMPMPGQYGQGYYQPPPPTQGYYGQPPAPEKKPNQTEIDMSKTNGDFKKSKIEFNDKPKYQDVWAAFVYILTVIVTIVIGVYSFMSIDPNKAHKTGSSSSQKTSYSKTSKYNKRARIRTSSSTPMKNPFEDADITAVKVATILGSAFGSAIILTMIYMFLVQRFTGKMIKGTFILAIILNFVYAVLAFFIHPLFGLLMLLFVGLYILCYFFWKSRIPFAKVVLKTVTSVTKKYPATIFVAFIGCVVGTIWYAFMTFTLAVSMYNWQYDNPRIAYVIYVFLVFSFFFSAEVINNVVHVTIAGVFATYYFRGVNVPGTNEIEIDVKNPTLKAYSRAMTTSFGSICFGSLLIAIVSTLRVLARNARNDAADDENIIMYIIACCIECILACIEDGIEYFNHYAFTEVAIYGKSYCEAAKDTWTLCKARGIEAIINDDIIGNVLSIGSLAVGCLSALITYGFSSALINSVIINIIFAVVALIVGCLIFSIVAQVINSGVATTFVCLCEDPDALHQTKPELWEKVRETYPDMVR